MRVSTRQAREKRPAIAAVEMALVAPILVLILTGMFEMGRLLLVKETLSNAAQRGCAVATQGGMSNSDVTQAIGEILSSGGFSNYTVTIQVNGVTSDVSNSSRLDKITVKVSVSASQVFWYAATFVTANTIQSETVAMMRQN